LLEELRGMSDQFEFVPRFGEEDESYTFVDVAGEEENSEVDGFLLTGAPATVENSAVVAHDTDTRTSDAATINGEQKMCQTPADYGLAPLLIDEIAKGQLWKVSLVVLVLMSLVYDGFLHSDARQSKAKAVARNKGEQVMVQSFELHVGEGFDVTMPRDTDSARHKHNMNYYPTTLSSLQSTDQRSAGSSVDQATKSLSVWDMFHAMEEQNVSLAPSSDSQSPDIPTPRPTSIKYTTALSILTPHRIVSRLEGAPQPVVVQGHHGMAHWQPAFIPVRSLIPFAAPRPSPVPDRTNMKHRMVPVPSTRAKVIAGRTPSLNETDTTNIIISEMSDSATTAKKVEPSHRPAIKRNIARSIDYASDELTQDTFNEFVHQYNRSFVIFYFPCASYDRLLVPVWQAFTLVMKPYIDQKGFKTGTVDCLAHPKVCEQQEISRFPTLRWYQNGGLALYGDYMGRRTVNKLLKYAIVRLYDADAVPLEEEADAEPVQKSMTMSFSNKRSS
jgi:Thioredoxin